MRVVLMLGLLAAKAICETLLFVFDLSSHGSTYPLTNLAGLEDPTLFPFLRGTLTEFGKR